MINKRLIAFGLMALAGLSLFAGCASEDPTSATQQPFSPVAVPQGDSLTEDDFLDYLKAGTFTVAKVVEAGSDVKFTFNTLAEGPGVLNAPLYVQQVELASGEYADVYTAPEEPGADNVTITEVVPEGWQVDRIFIWNLEEQDDGSFLTTSKEMSGPGATIQGSIDGGKVGCVVIYFNSEIPRECEGEIGDFVWNDVGGTKGIQDPDEPGIEGVRLTLMNEAGETIDETYTDENGYYLFDGLCAGTYKVTVDETTVPPGFMQTPTEVGDDPCVDNNVNPTLVTLDEDNSTDYCVDFGYMETPRGPGAGTPGYWHKPANWPVPSIEVGGVVYTAEEAAMYMVGGVKGDKSINLFRHTVAAMLNVIIGTDDSCVSDEIDAANAWLVSNPLGSGVDADSDAWQDEGSALLGHLDDYNNGRLCAPSRG